MKKVLLTNAIQKITTLWLFFFIFLVLVLLVQTIGDKYGTESNAAWAWFCINMAPGILLLLALLFRKKRFASVAIEGSDILLYRILKALVIAYLVAVTLVMLLHPLAPGNTEIEKLRSADTGLYIFQGILLAALCGFIYRVNKKLDPNEGSLGSEPGVFISYNHKDKAIAEKLCNMLKEKNIDVIIDYECMLAGEDIKTFIEKSIGTKRTTISIISVNSLLSGWVGMETINTFFLQRFLKDKQFIGCYLQDDFFKLDFTRTAIESFDKQLNDIETEIDNRQKLKADTRDLNDNKTRLLALRGNLDGIIQQLKGSLTVDIMDGKLEEKFPLILKSINMD